MFDNPIQSALTIGHAAAPQPGDYWSEHFCPVAVVLGVDSDGCVTVCETIKSVALNHWTWDLSVVKRYSRDEFRWRFTYGYAGNSSYRGEKTSEMAQEFWCDVTLGAHVDFADEWKLAHVNERCL